MTPCLRYGKLLRVHSSARSRRTGQSASVCMLAGVVVVGLQHTTVKSSNFPLQRLLGSGVGASACSDDTVVRQDTEKHLPSRLCVRNSGYIEFTILTEFTRFCRQPQLSEVSFNVSTQCYMLARPQNITLPPNGHLRTYGISFSFFSGTTFRFLLLSALPFTIITRRTSHCCAQASHAHTQRALSATATF